MKKTIFTIALLIASLGLVPAVGATSFNFQDLLDEFQQDVKDQSSEMQEDALGEEYDPEADQGIELPTFSDQGEGADVIVAGIRQFLNFFKLVVTPIAILTIVIMGVRMVTAGKDNEEVTTKAKTYIQYALEGIIVIFVSDSLVQVFFGPEGEVFRGGAAGAAEYGRRVSLFLRGVYSLAQVIISSIAVFVLVTAGMRFVAGASSEDQISSAKKQITWALGGLFIIGISEFVVKNIIFQNQGTSLGIDEAKRLMVSFTNFAAGTIGTLAFVFLFYAGYLYALGSQDEENVSKAKKIVTGVVLGIILALGAFALTTTILDLAAS